MAKRVLVVLAVGFLVSCGSSGTSASCATVKNPTLLVAIKADKAEAVRAGVDGDYYVAAPGGATWFTHTVDMKNDDSGLILPLNDEARAQSDTGADVQAGSPVFRGKTATDAGAAVARSCAG